VRNPEKCRTEEVREIRHKQLKDQEWYVVCFKYTIDYFPDFWNREGYSITKEIEEDMPFDRIPYVKDYLKYVSAPSIRLSKNDCDDFGLKYSNHYTVWLINIKEEILPKEKYEGNIFASAYDLEEYRSVGFTFIRKWYDWPYHLTIVSSVINKVTTHSERREPQITTTVQSSTVISDSILDQITKDVEKLRNTKNAFIVEEIERSVKYINTLKKLL
jgi:hypothetical protein